MTHTPTPWDYYDSDGQPSIVTNDGSWRGTIANVELSEDAAHIVKCVNTHEALIAALSAAYTRLLSIGNYPYRLTAAGQAELCLIRDALADGTGKTSEAVQVFHEDKATASKGAA